MSVIIFLIILSLLVVVHELGHFIAAKKQNILVEEFGIGYPPRIFGFKFKETIYSINLIPLGGFVKVYGEELGEKINLKFKKKSFSYKKPWQRAIVLVAGVFGNFILGWLLFSYLFTQGLYVPTNEVIIDKIVKNSPADQAGIKSKDKVIKIIYQNNIHNIKSSQEFIDLTKKYAGKKIILVVKRDNKIINIPVIPRKKPPKGEGPLGIVITSLIKKKYPWYQAPFYGLLEAINITIRIIEELIKTIILNILGQRKPIEVVGPIGIAHFTSQVIKFGKNALLQLTALLSINLSIINLLPFPALDGGRLCFVFYEWLTKKKPNPNFEKKLNLIGFAILITIALLISFKDINRLLTK